MAQPLRVVILKPSKYTRDGYVERFRWGFMPNSTMPFVRSMTPAALGDTPLEIHAMDEYVHGPGLSFAARAAPRGAGRCSRWWARERVQWIQADTTSPTALEPTRGHGAEMPWLLSRHVARR